MLNVKRIFKIIVFILLIILGAALFVFGEYDDSPGGQLLGLVAGISGTLGVVRNFRQAS